MASSPRRPDEQGSLQLDLSAAGDEGGDDGLQPGDGERRLTGTLARIVYQDQTSHWTVARLSATDAAGDAAETDPVTVVGNMAHAYEGMPVAVLGAFHEHPRYGTQFRVRAYHPVLPETLAGLERYLGSKQFSGVGPELARRVVAHFGHDTVPVLERASARLTEVEGIGAARAKAIADAWNKHRERRDINIFLHTYGITAAYQERVYSRYGSDAIRLIRENPYRLTIDIWGIGFKIADAIARNLGIESTAPERLEAGLLHVLGKLGEDGHLHAPEANLLDTAADLLEVERIRLPPALERLEHSGLIVRESLGDRGPCISLEALWASENQAAQYFCELVRTAMRPMQVDVVQAIAGFESEVGMQLARAQRRAIEAAILDKCVVITGGPGVGKTTIVRAIVNIMRATERSMALCAPTGRAAKRLTESTGVEALTVHRLLEFQPRIGAFLRDEDNPLEVDAVIVDEVSMVDIHLFQSLLAAIPPPAQLLLVGDIDQLPSVGPGAVLSDVIESGQATVVRLTEIFRQAAESRIITAAHEVNRGVLPTLEPPPGRDAKRSDFYFIRRDDPEAARDTLVTVVSERIPRTFGLSPIHDIQVLCPMHRGELGTRALNLALQEQLNPGKSGVLEVERGDRVYRVGDKVMQIKNDYDHSVFNGDIGVVQDIAGDDKKLVVDFNSGRVVVYKRDELDKLVHAYAVSVHKSQGSEYPAVVMPLTTHHYMMLQRNLLYTALTRGKQLVVLVGNPRAIALATRNQSTSMRWTWLAQRIRHGAELE